MGLQRWYSQKMATDRLPLHLCNSIKQYWLEIETNLHKIQTEYLINLKTNLRQIELQEKVKLVVLLVLLLTQNSNGNSFSGSRNSMLRTRVIGTRYGRLQGVILPMDQHKYLKPVEAYLGVPYATPPTGSNRYVLFYFMLWRLVYSTKRGHLFQWVRQIWGSMFCRNKFLTSVVVKKR